MLSYKQKIEQGNWTSGSKQRINYQRLHDLLPTNKAWNSTTMSNAIQLHLLVPHHAPSTVTWIQAHWKWVSCHPAA